MTWEDADGISFWVEGTGSDQFMGLQFIWNDDYALRYDSGFWVTGEEWTKITVPWRDFVAVTSKEGAIPLSKTQNSPAKLGPFWFGKWWYWRDYPQLSFSVDEISLEAHIPLTENRDSDNPLNASEAVPTGLTRVQAKLQKGEPLQVVTMGDAIDRIRRATNNAADVPVMTTFPGVDAWDTYAELAEAARKAAADRHALKRSSSASQIPARREWSLLAEFPK